MLGLRLQAIKSKKLRTYCVANKILRGFRVCATSYNNTEPAPDKQALLKEKYQNRLVYNTIINKDDAGSWIQMQKTKRFMKKVKFAMQSVEPIPISLRYLDETPAKSETTENSCETLAGEYVEQSSTTQFPYSTKTTHVSNTLDTDYELIDFNKNESIEDEIRAKNKFIKTTDNWMEAYDNYEYDLVDNESSHGTYGTPDPNCPISSVPCGGCGALLHCKDTGIPGYIPSEIFKNYSKNGAAHLSAILCQRCHFLKEYNLALQVQVTAEDYPKTLSVIRNRKALAVLMVDLLDMPCSVWPGITEILGPKRPIVVVGNKVDLLPKDGDKYLTHIKKQLLDTVKVSGFATADIRSVNLISAKTGFGIEQLITDLQTVWKFLGDVYLVGCTNVGKSSLFNALLQSDYCKIQAADLIQKATTSPWPGTTLNLLKFPITRPSGFRTYLRHERLKQLHKIEAVEAEHRQTQLVNQNTILNATLIGHIGRSDIKTEPKETVDGFAVMGHSNESGKLRMGINENHSEYVHGRWCYDTPGVIQPDQILHLLTTDELMKVLPKELIRPQTFCVKPGTTLFIAGLGRLDYSKGCESVRLTVFKSNDLPITICNIEDAQDIYNELLGTDLFLVPFDTGDRLAKWPGLQVGNNTFKFRGKCWKNSSYDILLSSAGWVAVNCSPEHEFEFKAWTPEKRGIYLRECLLPRAVTLRGPRILKTVAYSPHKFI